MDAHSLYEALDRFVNDNRHSRSVELRWLAFELCAAKALAHDFGVNGISPAGKKHSDAIGLFRKQEIDAEIGQRESEIERLRREQRLLTGAKMAAE
jgi:uncharacterized small protein (DUF1192 family)